MRVDVMYALMFDVVACSSSSSGGSGIQVQQRGSTSADSGAVDVLLQVKIVWG